jgi:uncharacterized protein (TIGR01777 family)
MKVLVSGSSGMVGTALRQALRSDGHSAASLVRPGSALQTGDVRWDPVTGELDLAAAEGAEAAVHLAGASIAAGRWNDERKRVIRDSRVEATRRLVTALGKLKRRPAVLISASAIGIYGDRGEEELTEQSAPGGDFLSQVARDWEAEAARAEQAGIRVVCLRFGVILAAHGGALAKMLLPFRWGLGGKIGSGRQWMSWLTLGEAVGMVRYALENAKLRGPVNAVAPTPVRNADFTQALARAVSRPAIFPMPAFAARLAFGEMADALLLASQRVLPAGLQESGYTFRQAELAGALQAVLRDAAK